MYSGFMKDEWIILIVLGFILYIFNGGILLKLDFSRIIGCKLWDEIFFIDKMIFYEFLKESSFCNFVFVI